MNLLREALQVGGALQLNFCLPLLKEVKKLLPDLIVADAVHLIKGRES